MITTVLLAASLGLGADPAPLMVQFEPQPNSAAVVVYPPESTLIRHSNQPLSDIAQQAWVDSFAKTSFFSAFAYSKNGGYGFATTTNTPEAARAIALAQCQGLNDQCRIIAEIQPAGYKPLAPGQIPVSTEIAGHYRTAQTLGAHRAMAISADGAYATAWGYATQTEADALALRDCEGYRDLSLSAPGDWPCILLPGLD